MTIWFAMFIPVVIAVVLMLFFHRRTKWWEFALPFLVSALLCGGFKMMAEAGATRDSEVWGGWVTEARYYERWNEYIHQTCYRQQCSGFGKNRTCVSVPYDCSYVANHPERWEISDSNGAKHEIGKERYSYFKSLFGQEPLFVDLKRNYHSVDGDMYKVQWPKTPATVEPVTTLHLYQNRVQASRSVFQYVPVPEEEAQAKGLFEYPEVQLFDYPTVLGDCGPQTEAADKQLRYFNAVLGREKQLRIWFLCFNSADAEVGQLQEAYWVGGNKNEVVIAVGTGPEGNVNWVHPFSWTDRQQPLVEIRDFILAQESLDPVSAAGFIGPKLKEEFVRKQFADFSYLTVEPPLWAVITTYVVTLLVNIGLSWWLVINEFHEGSSRRRRRY